VKYGCLFVVAFIRLPERVLVRFVGGAACAAWTGDAQTLAIGGDWGVLLAVPAPESKEQVRRGATGDRRRA